MLTILKKHCKPVKHRANLNEYAQPAKMQNRVNIIKHNTTCGNQES